MHSLKVHSNESACRKVDVLGWNKSYVVMVIILKKRKYVKIRYNTDNIQMLCIINESYSTVAYLKTQVRSDRSDRKNKLDLFIANWSYSYNK